MKKVKFIFSVVVSVFLTISAVVASGINTDATELKASENIIRKQFESVLSSVPYEGSVDVYIKFTVSDKSGLTIDDVKSEDTVLASQVKSILAKSSLYVPSSLNGSYLVKVKFVDKNELVYVAPSKDDIVRQVISEKLSSVFAIEGSDVDVYFAVKDNMIEVKKVDGDNAGLVKSVSLALTDTKINDNTLVDGAYQVKVRF